MRAFKLLLLILALVPTVWLHGPRPPGSREGPAHLVDLMPALRADLPETGGLHLLGAWQIAGRNRNLGTLSGLAQTGGGFVAVGDRGAAMWFPRPDRPGPWRLTMRPLVDLDWATYRYPTDAESVTVDPGTGSLTVAYEGANQLERYSADLRQRSIVVLPVLGEWPENEGPEAMARLIDGRTVIIGETYAHWFDLTRHPGLIFAGAPRRHETPARFELAMPSGYKPCEMTQMPDGRLLVLGRYFSYTSFHSVIAIFAPQDVRPGATVTPRVIAHIDDPRIRDNYEGMTVTREPDGSQVVWLVSDSNEMSVLQRTLLLKLRIGPEVR